MSNGPGLLNASTAVRTTPDCLKGMTQPIRKRREDFAILCLFFVCVCACFGFSAAGASLQFASIGSEASLRHESTAADTKARACAGLNENETIRE